MPSAISSTLAAKRSCRDWRVTSSRSSISCHEVAAARSAATARRSSCSAWCSRPIRVGHELARATVRVAVGGHLAAGAVAELAAGGQVGDPVQVGKRVDHAVRATPHSGGTTRRA